MDLGHPPGGLDPVQHVPDRGLIGRRADLQAAAVEEHELVGALGKVPAHHLLGLPGLARPRLRVWPTQGFSQSSGIPNVWNFWIIYPVGAWVFVTAAYSWLVYGNKPVSESEIKREMERQAGSR